MVPSNVVTTPTLGRTRKQRRVTTLELCAQTGVTLRQIRYWMSLNVLQGDDEDPLPSCAKRRIWWNEETIPVVRCLGQLAANGAGCDQLRAAYQHLCPLSAKQWRGKIYVSPAGIISRHQTGPVAHSLNLDDTKGERLAYLLAAYCEQEER